MPDHNSHRTSDKRMQSEIFKEYLQSHDCVETYLLKILEDCFNMNPLYRKVDFLRDCKTISRRFCNEGLYFAVKTLPNLFDNLLRYLETGISVYPGFRLSKGEKYPVFLRQLFRPIYVDQYSVEAGLCMQHLYQLCAAFEKLKGPFKQGVLIKQLDEFISVDESLSKTEFTDDDIAILCLARSIIGEIVGGLDPLNPSQSELFLPRPGPGATNTPTKKCERYRPHTLYPQIEALMPSSEWHTAYPSWKSHEDGLTPIVKDNCIKLVENTSLKSLHEKGLLTSRFKFVHKKYGKPRCICIEQLEIQWRQQALRRALYDRVEKHPLSKGYVNFTDQSINGHLALLNSNHSISERFATIDMSSASDRISRPLVEFLFMQNCNLLKVMLSLSTRIVELPKDVPYSRKYLHMNKFAPMGSALCFPVMGLVHFALIKSIIALSSAQDFMDVPVWVYGDDIILPNAHAKVVMETLPHFGMKINADKSFVKSAFRESCGIHAYNGINITPVRLKTVVTSNSSMSVVVSALQNESALFKRGYTETAKFIRSELRGIPGLQASKFVAVSSKSPALGWIRDQGELHDFKSFRHLKRKWSSDFQRFLFKASVIVDLLDDDPPPLDDVEAYLKALVTRPKTDERLMNESPIRFKILRQWLPDSAFSNY